MSQRSVEHCFCLVSLSTDILLLDDILINSDFQAEA